MREGCELCKYYVQHYNLLHGTISQVGCGHCMKPTEDDFFRSTDHICEFFEEVQEEPIEEVELDLFKEMKILQNKIDKYLERIDLKKDAK